MIVFTRLPEARCAERAVLITGWTADALTSYEGIRDTQSDHGQRFLVRVRKHLGKNLGNTTRKGTCQWPRLNQKILFPFWELCHRRMFKASSSVVGFSFHQVKEQQTRPVRISIEARENEFHSRSSLLISTARERECCHEMLQNLSLNTSRAQTRAPTKVNGHVFESHRQWEVEAG